MCGGTTEEPAKFFGGGGALAPSAAPPLPGRITIAPQVVPLLREGAGFIAQRLKYPRWLGQFFRSIAVKTHLKLTLCHIRCMWAH